MNKKIVLVFLVLIVLLSTTVFAATVSSEKATFEVVENNTCTIKINDNAYFEKKLIDYDLDKKEVTIGLKVVNNSVKPIDGPCEVVLLIDNSNSMNDSISTGGTRMNAIVTSAKTLVNDLMVNDNVKISVVSFSTVYNTALNYQDPSWIPEGTLQDASLKTSLTNNKETVLTSIDNIVTDNKGIRTDIEAGLVIASEQFSGTIDNKYIVLLTDGVPNVSLTSNAKTGEENFYTSNYDQVDIINTKNALINLSNNGINILSMMTGVTDEPAGNGNLGTFKDIAEAVFGTPENPTVGKFYYITDNLIEETITETILNDLSKVEGEILRDIDIYDYFPQDIVSNFNFSYVQQPNIGTVSEDIDLQNNRIIWHIDRLSYGEVATLSYKLSLKDNINENIINIILDTNEKVDITTANILDENDNKKLLTSDVTPKVRVNLESTPTPTPDKTVAPTPIPQTGVIITVSIIIGGGVIAGITFGIITFIKSRKIK